jgi:hypothetical protein
MKQTNTKKKNTLNFGIDYRQNERGGKKNILE